LKFGASKGAPHRLKFIVALALCHLSASAVSPAAASDTCGGCTALGTLNVMLLSIDPAEPAVGDEVTITYAYEASGVSGFDCNGLFAGSCEFVGGEPYLPGDVAPTVVNSQIVVHRTVVQAGVATIQLDASAETEIECFIEDEFGCLRLLDPGFVDASSGPFDLQLQPAPAQHNDGCAIAQHPTPCGPLAYAALLVPVLVLRTVRRHSVRAASSISRTNCRKSATVSSYGRP
jgi:hypothetical protein